MFLGGGGSVGIVRSRTQIMEFVFFLFLFLGSKVRPVRRADILTAICKPTI
jgi:hypothetical protein